ncbi:NACHT domain-containing protein [Mucilaginibacter sp. UR6-1]|uniref:NACHT domain-containing protein n=1 Tax=Mucilaginibacter sp. UR6-1 TaxID=1435643 RepID=UPI001E54382B|nr:NACHT domain-containing protein [Mucilaginibacter sp. UR6-1]MCC8408225.1 NACHT domain-containing protein [Mucilaginibacter sp. UR6-1]
MNAIHPNYIEQLKASVLTIAGITNITPCDCRIIAASIFNKTRHQLSETTLKRVFGFAHSKFNPSLYTIDVMATYCGYSSWAAFCESQQTNNTTNNDPVWDTLKLRADKVTRFTLQALKNRSGIPYANTINRKLIDLHFDAFFEGNNIATVITAPAGYGKTLALCRWLDDRLNHPESIDNKDIILFFSSSAMISSFMSGRSVNEWLLDLLGYSPEKDIPSVLANAKDDGRKFILIIDGLDEHQFKPEQFQNILDQLANVFSFYQSCNRFKFIVTMRTSSWTNHKHVFDNGEKWFLGTQYGAPLLINVPLLSVDELRQLSKNLGNDAKLPHDIKLIEKFSYPLYLQFYYKKNKHNFSLHHANHVSVNELIAEFIINKVYLSNNSAEKILLLNAFIDEMRPDDGYLSVCKLKVNHLLKQYNSAYRELLGIGVLREINESEGLKYHISIQFMKSDFLEYMLARKLLHLNDYKFDQALVNNLNELEHTNALKLPVLKWCLMYTIQNGKTSKLSAVNTIAIDITERTELLRFLIELISRTHQNKIQNNDLNAGIDHTIVNELFDHFVHPELIEPCNEDILLAFSKYNISPANRASLYIALSFTATTALDLTKLEKYINQIKLESKSHYETYPIHPLSCLEFIFNYLKFGTIDPDFIVKLTKYLFKPVDKKAEKPSLYQIYLTVLSLAARVCDNPYKEARLAKKLNEEYGSNDRYFNLITNALTANRYINTGYIVMAVNLLKDIENLTQVPGTKNAMLSDVLLHEIKIKLALTTGDYDLQANTFDKFEQLTTNGNYNLPKLLLLQFILSVFGNSPFVKKHEKELSYQFSKMLIRLGVSKAGLQSEKHLNNIAIIFKKEQNSYV